MTLALVAMSFVACTEDDPAKPTITINENVDIDLEKVQDADFKISLNVASADENINWIIVSITDVNGVAYQVEEIKDVKAKEFTKDYVLNDLAAILLTLNTAQVAPKSFDVQVSTPTHALTTASQGFVLPEEPQPTPLADAKDFSWNRKGSDPGTGDLALFGLEWKNNTATNIVITPAAGTKLVELAVSDWTTIETKEGLAEVVDAATGIEKWEVIPTKITFDYVIATKTAEGKYFLINATERTINPNDGGDRTVTGKYKE